MNGVIWSYLDKRVSGLGGFLGSFLRDQSPFYSDLYDGIRDRFLGGVKYIKQKS